MWNLRRHCKAPLEANSYLSIFRCLTNAQKGELTIVSEVHDLFLMLRNSDVWTTLCENDREFCMRFAASFPIRNVFENDFADMEMTKKHWRPSQEMSTNGWYTRAHRGITQGCENQLHFDYAIFATSDYVIRHLMGLFHVYYGKSFRDVWVQCWEGGNSRKKRGCTLVNAPWAKVNESSGKVTLQTLERDPFALTIFHHWLRYAEIVPRVMCTIQWRH